MITKDFGLRVKQLRTQMGLSQEKFALQIGIDRTYLASIEKGMRNVSLINLEKIANGFNISLSDLFMGL